MGRSLFDLEQDEDVLDTWVHLVVAIFDYGVAGEGL